MRKKILVFTMTFCMALGGLGCNTDKNTVQDNISDKEQDKKSECVFGSDNTDYSVFEYLEKETLTTEAEKNEETGEMESQNIDVLVPKSDNIYVNEERISSDKMGVKFHITLNPYIQYHEEDYLIRENMEKYLTYTFDPFYNSNYADIVISEIEEHDENCVSATVSFLEYNSWDKKYLAYDNSYMLMELDNGLLMLVEVEIIYSDTTGKTVELIEELEKFYGFEIAYDKDAAAKKEEDYLKSNNNNKRNFSTGYFAFELPANWDNDWDFSGNAGSYAYAPDGDADTAGCVITIDNEYFGEISEFNSIFNDIDAYKQLLEDQIGYTLNNFAESNVNTVLGEGIKLTFDTNENGQTNNYSIYYVYNNSEIYVIQAYNSVDSEDAISIAEEILQNGIVRE